MENFIVESSSKRQIRVSQVALVVKDPPANARDLKNMGSIPGLGRSPGAGHGNPLQYSCLENSIDRGTWRAAVHGVARSWTRLSDSTFNFKGFPSGSDGKASACNAGDWVRSLGWEEPLEQGMATHSSILAW